MAERDDAYARDQLALRTVDPRITKLRATLVEQRDRDHLCEVLKVVVIEVRVQIEAALLHCGSGDCHDDHWLPGDAKREQPEPYPESDRVAPGV